MAAIAPLITTAGRNAAIAASGSGLQLAITHIALGAGKYTPTIGLTALADRREKAAAAAGSSSPGSFTVIASFLGYAGAEYDLGEIGFYAGDPDAGGILFAVASAPAPARFSVRTPSAVAYTVDFEVALSGVPAGSITVTVDPSAGTAASLLAAHLAAPNPHPQYAQDSVPVGAEMAFMRRTAPLGWLTECGALVSRTAYADLWALAQAQGLVVTEVEWAAGAHTFFSSGNGTTTFRLPDMRGEFVRGWDNGRWIDPNRALGGWQVDQFKSHTHDMGQEAGGGSNLSTAADTTGTDERADGNPTSATGGTETRPRNAARLIAIKAGAQSLPAGPEPSVLGMSVSDASAVEGQTVTFTSFVTGTPAASYLWDFGDGTFSTLSAPTKAYSTAGSYDVTLTVRTAADVVSRLTVPDMVIVTVDGSLGGAGGGGIIP